MSANRTELNDRKWRHPALAVVDVVRLRGRLDAGTAAEAGERHGRSINVVSRPGHAAVDRRLL